jgi:hypothetical protein
MHARPLAAVAAIAALAVPAFALAEGIGPHATGYQQHPGSTKPGNGVEMIVHRDKHNADVFVDNFCLGTESGGGSQKYPDSAIARGIQVSHGKIFYSGKATIYTQTGQRQVPMRFAARIKPKTAKGTVKFPGTQCGTIAFKAKRTQRTK